MTTSVSRIAMRWNRIRGRANTGLRRWSLFLTVAVLVGASCGNEQPRDDLDYLAWEVCRQVRTEGMTADDVSGILVDATRHGAVMDRIEAECGDEIAAVYRDDG
ncbi:MAG: hypothetical protein F4Y40_00130 [Acidimicrobiia bacterium]|nr:hypothetical protein [Acidimicrobiia bacterium]MYF84087.1 hypothetical protein [Acidimicrobiia bacterium]